jgi:hypothetical protein
VSDPKLKEFERAIEAAGDAGDLEAVGELAQAMRIHLQRQDPSLGSPKPFAPGQEGMPATIRSMVRQESRGNQAYAGAGGALATAYHGLRGHDSTNPDVQNWKALNTASGDTIGGNMVGTAALFGAGPTRLGAEATGMAMSRVPPWLAGRWGTVADTAITGGILNAATTPGTAPERAYEGLFGIAGAGIPGLYAAGATGRRMATTGGKRVAVGEGVLEERGADKAEQLISSLRDKDPGASIGVSSTAAMKTQDPILQTLESGSRAKRGDLWKPLDQQNAKARWDALVGKAGTKEELEAMESGLNAKTGALREQALTDAQISTAFSQSGDVTKEMLKPMERLVADWRFRFRPNRETQKLANYIEGELGQGLTPDQLYQVRKELTDMLKPGRNDELSNAAKTSRKQTMDAIKEIDGVLNTLSGGGWGEYLSKHSQGMRPIESKQALQDIVGSLERGMPTGVVPPAMGESAAWKTVGTLRDRFGTKELGKKTVDTLLPEDRELVNAIADSLKRQADSMTAKATLGSPTTPLIANAGRADAVSRNVLQQGVARMLPGGDILASKVFDKLGRQGEEELARLLQDPNALAEAIVSAMRARQVQAGASRLGAGSGAAGGN